MDLGKEREEGEGKVLRVWRGNEEEDRGVFTDYARKRRRR